MNIRKSAAASAALMIAGLAFAGLSASPAAASPEQCSSNRFCLYEDENFQAVFAGFTRNQSQLFDRDLDDKTTAIINNTDDAWCVYSDVSYTGSRREIGPRQVVSSLLAYEWQFNDVISSISRGGC
ncbi:peptidase inhibitor family I36 protein [Embleya sp. NPDC055664]